MARFCSALLGCLSAVLFGFAFLGSFWGVADALQASGLLLMSLGFGGMSMMIPD